MLKLVLLIPAVALALLIAALMYLALLFAWWSRHTRGLNYFGLPIAQRRRFRARVRRYGVLVLPLIRLGVGKLVRPEWLDLRVAGLVVPRSACSGKSLTAALAWRPAAGDIIVATQMKCGTTWMQQIIYELLSRGQGDLGDSGHVHLNAMSPWLEAVRGVPFAEAPRIGERGARIVKTHLPASNCPYSPEARYVYVTRHPVSCYLSCLEFTRTNGGPVAREGPAALDWFCGNRMWWGSWPDHVAGWWDWAISRPNVRFVHFEEMKADLPAVLRRLAHFLSLEISDIELDLVARKCSFDFMKEREEWFEMSPPTVFAAGSSLFKSGSAERDAGADRQTRERIIRFCRSRLAARAYPAPPYPELARPEAPARAPEAHEQRPGL